MKTSTIKSLIAIQNALIAKRKIVILEKTITCQNLLNILWNEGFIVGYKVSLENVKVTLKYLRNKAVIQSFRLFTANNSIYSYSKFENWKVNSIQNFVIFSTNLGLKTFTDCKKLKIGGKPFILIN